METDAHPVVDVQKIDKIAPAPISNNVDNSSMCKITSKLNGTVVSPKKAVSKGG